MTFRRHDELGQLVDTNTLSTLCQYQAMTPMRYPNGLPFVSTCYHAHNRRRAKCVLLASHHDYINYQLPVCRQSCTGNIYATATGPLRREPTQSQFQILNEVSLRKWFGDRRIRRHERTIGCTCARGDEYEA